MNNKRAQVAMEYIIVVTAIIAAVLLALPKVKGAVSNIFGHSTNQAQNVTEQKFNLME